MKKIVEVVLEVGDIVSTRKQADTRYEVTELIEGGKVRLQPLESGLGSFAMKPVGLVVRVPKTPREPEVKQKRPRKVKVTE